METEIINDVEIPLIITSQQNDHVKVKRERQSQSDEENDGEEKNKEKGQEIIYEPPDGGWGWFVVAGTTICMMTMSTQGPCFGIFYGDRLRELGGSPTLAAWLFNFQSVTWNIAGPWTGLLCDKFSYRPVAMVTACIAVSSLILSAVVTNPYLLLLTFSTLSGIGGGICINCCYQLSAKYFQKRLGLANGIMVTGGSLGLILLPQLASHLQSRYSFEGATLIAAAVMLNVIAATMLFQPVEWHAKISVAKPQENGLLFTEVEKEECQKLVTFTSRLASDISTEFSQEGFPRCSSVPLDLVDRNGKKINQSPLISPKRKRAMSESPFDGGFNRGSGARCLEINGMENSRMSIFQYGGSTLMGSVLTLPQKLQQSNKKCREGQHLTREERGIWKQFLSHYQPSELKDPLVISVALITCITISSALNLFSTVPFILNDAGYSLQSAASAMSTAAVADLVTRLVCALISDRPWVNVRALYAAAQCIFIVVPCVLINGSQQWWLVIVCMCCMGVGLGIMYALDVFIIVRLLGVQKLESVYGMSQVFRVIAFITLGPTGGILRDVTGSYTTTIVFYSCAIVLAMNIILFTVFYTCWRSHHSSQTSE